VRRPILLLLLVVACGCSGREGISVSGQRTDSSGTLVVQHALEPFAQTITESWRIVDSARVRIDSVPRAVLPMLYKITGAAILESGDIVIGHGGGKELLLFDSTGHFIRVVGREGAGPGEFRSLSGPWRVAGNRFAVYDLSLRRVTVFIAPDSLERTTPVTVRALADSSYLVWRAFGVTPSGIALLWVDGAPLRTPGMSRPAMSVIAMDSAGKGTKVGPSRPGLARYVMAPRTDGFVSMGLSPFAPSPVAAVCGENVLVADNEVYSATVLALDSHPSMIVRADVERRTASDLDYFAVVRAQFGAEAKVTEEVIRPMRMMTPSGLLPVLRAMYCDSAMNMWIEEFPYEGSTQTRVVSYTPNGVRRFAIVLPTGMRLLAVEGVRIAVVVTDDDGIERVEILGVAPR
jgi:hypothetical protein